MKREKKFEHNNLLSTYGHKIPDYLQRAMRQFQKTANKAGEYIREVGTLPAFVEREYSEALNSYRFFLDAHKLEMPFPKYLSFLEENRRLQLEELG